MSRESEEQDLESLPVAKRRGFAPSSIREQYGSDSPVAYAIARSGAARRCDRIFLRHSLRSNCAPCSASDAACSRFRSRSLLPRRFTVSSPCVGSAPVAWSSAGFVHPALLNAMA